MVITYLLGAHAPFSIPAANGEAYFTYYYSFHFYFMDIVFLYSNHN